MIVEQPSAKSGRSDEGTKIRYHEGHRGLPRPELNIVTLLINTQSTNVEYGNDKRHSDDGTDNLRHNNQGIERICRFWQQFVESQHNPYLIPAACNAETKNVSR